MANSTDPNPRDRRLLFIHGRHGGNRRDCRCRLLVNIVEHKQEARNPFYRVVELNDTIDDPATWGKNFPMQYDLYLRTVDMRRTRYGGSEAEPRSPTEAIRAPS